MRFNITIWWFSRHPHSLQVCTSRSVSSLTGPWTLQDGEDYLSSLAVAFPADSLQNAEVFGVVPRLSRWDRM